MYKIKITILLVIMTITFPLFNIVAYASNISYNFNDKKEKIGIVTDGSTIAGAGFYNRHKNAGNFTYEDKVYAKGETDFSPIVYTDNVVMADQAYDGFSICGSQQITAPKSFEFSFIANGDYDDISFKTYAQYGESFLDIKRELVFLAQFKQNGKIYLLGKDSNLTYNKNQWQRLGFTIYPNGTCDIWINAKKVKNSVPLSSDKNNFYGLRWIQLTQDVPKNSAVVTKELRNIMLGIDDYCAFDGIIIDDAQNNVDLKNDSKVEISDNMIYLKSEMYTSEFIQKVGNDCKIQVYKDELLKENQTHIENGNTLVLNSPNGKIFKYYKVCYNILYYYQDFNNPESCYFGYTLNSKKDTNSDKINKVDVYNDYLYFDKTFVTNDCHADFQMSQTQNEIVIESDISVRKFGSDAQLFFLRDNTSEDRNLDCTLINLNKNGELKSGKSVKKIDLNNWYNITTIINIKEKKCTILIEDTIFVQNYVFTDKNINMFSMLRFRMCGDYVGDLCVDNVKIYSGTQKRPVNPNDMDSNYNSIFKTNAYSETLLKNKTAIHMYSGNMFYSGQKVKTAIAPVIEDDEVYIAIDDARKLLFNDITVNNENIIIANKIFAINSKKYNDNSEMKLLKYEPKRVNNVVMLPLWEIAKTIGLFTKNDNRGLIVISKEDSKISNNALAEINGYLFHIRPGKSEILNLFNQKKDNQHPRVLANSQTFTQIKNQTDGDMVKWKSEAILRADNILTLPANKYEIPDGLRLLSVSTSVVSRIMDLGFAYQMTNDKKYSNRAWVEINAVCNFVDWNAYKHFLDSAEMSFAVGVAYDWMYDCWSQSQKDVMVTALKKFGLGEAQKVYTNNYNLGSKFWANSNINWNGVCNGGIAVSALAIMEEDPEYCAQIVSYAIRGLEYAWYEIAPDGAWDEGVGYWGYFLKYATRLFSTLDISLGTDFNYFKFKSADKIGYFQAQLSSPQGANNFHDASQSHQSISGLHYFTKKYANKDFSNIRIKYLKDYAQNAEIEDLLWYVPFENDTPINIDKCTYFRNVEAVGIREKWFDNNAMFTSFHGGKTVGGHNHYDSGAFVYEVLGERWALDLGAENYNLAAQYGNESLYRVRAEGHNTLVFNPSQEAGQDADGFAPIVRNEFGDSQSFSVMDLSSNYKKYASSVVRSFFVSDNNRSLTVRDEISLKNETQIYWFMHTKASVTKISDNQLKLTQNGKTVNLSLVTDALNYEITVMNAQPLPTSPIVEPQNKNDGIKKVAIKIIADNKVNLSVKLSPDKENLQPTAENISNDKLTIDKIDNSFPFGNKNNLFGKKADDNCVFEKDYTLNINEKLQGNNSKISFYTAFDDLSKDNIITSNVTIDTKGDTEIPFINFKKDGTITIADTLVSENNIPFVKNKWYKTDVILKSTKTYPFKNLVTLYLDNNLIAKDVELASNIFITKINTLNFDNIYLDDFVYGGCLEDNIVPIVLVHPKWIYNKYISNKKGLISFCEEKLTPKEINNFGTREIKNMELVENDIQYIVLETSQNQKIYMPFFEIGEKSYENKNNINNISFSNQPLSKLPFTMKFDIIPKTNDKIQIKADGKYYDFISFKENSVIQIGSQTIADIWKNNENMQVSISVYPDKKACDISINSKNAAVGKNMFDFNLNTLEELSVYAGNINNILCYSGGFSNDKRILTPTFSVSENVDINVNAQSLKEINADLIVSFYEGNKLKNVVVNPITINNKKSTFSCPNISQTQVKVMLFESLNTLKPLK